MLSGQCSRTDSNMTKVVVKQIYTLKLHLLATHFGTIVTQKSRLNGVPTCEDHGEGITQVYSKMTDKSVLPEILNQFY